MEHLYDIIIAGQTVHKGLSEEEFFDMMSDLSTTFYEEGHPDPSTVIHKMYIKE